MIAWTRRITLATLVISGCAGNDAILHEDGAAEADTGAATSEWRLELTPDEGIRVACASIPRIDRDDEGYYIYHDSKLTSMSGHSFATSSDGLTFGSSSKSSSTMTEGVQWFDRKAFADRVQLPTTSDLTDACNGASFRIYHHNGAFGGMGDGIHSKCSNDGTSFTLEQGERITSADGGRVGVVGAYALGERVYLLTMDGQNPGADGTNRHRVWHYQSTDGTGDSFELLSDDPLGQGSLTDTNFRHNDPVVRPLNNGENARLACSAPRHQGSDSVGKQSAAPRRCTTTTSSPRPSNPPSWIATCAAAGIAWDRG